MFLEVWMKKILLILIVFISIGFLYQNIEMDLLNKAQKKLLLKETNLANQLNQYRPSQNKNNDNPTIEIDQEPNTKATRETKINNNDLEKEDQTQTETQTQHQAEQTITTSPDILAMLEKVSFEDQLKVANILLKRFSFSELNKYRTMVSNGINEEEKTQIKELVLSRLTEEDLKRLREIAESYVLEYYPDQQERLITLTKRYLEE